MKKTEGKRTSVAEYVRKRAYGQQVNVEQRKESTSAACEKTATGQQEEKKSDLELLRECCEKEKYFLEMFQKMHGNNADDVRARALKVQALEQAIQALTGEKTAEEKEEPKEQTPLPVMKNNTQRKEWLADYRSWGVWYADKHIGAVYYKYDFDNGAKLIVEEYEDTLTILRKTEKCISQYYHLVGGPEPVRRTDGSPKWSRHENYTKYPDSESELVEFLKDIQK